MKSKPNTMTMGVIWSSPTGGYRFQVFKCLTLMFQAVMLGKHTARYCQIAIPKVKRYNLVAHVWSVLINFPKDISHINRAVKGWKKGCYLSVLSVFSEHHQTRLVCENERLRLMCKNETVLMIYSATFGHLLHGSPFCPQEPGSHIDMGLNRGTYSVILNYPWVTSFVHSHWYKTVKLSLLHHQQDDLIRVMTLNEI